MAAKRRLEDQARERALVARSKDGDRAAFGELFEMYRRPVFRLCLDRLGDAGLAEDAVQDTFARAFSALDRFDSARRFFPWVATIAVNRSEDLRRREERQRPSGLSPLDDRTGGAVVVGGDLMLGGDVEIRAIDRYRLEAALSALPTLQRRMILRHDLEGWTCAEVADAEGRTELAVRSSLSRARATLRMMLETLGLAGAGLRDLWRRARGSTQRMSVTPAGDLVVASMGTGVLAISAATVMLAAAMLSGANQWSGRTRPAREPVAAPPAATAAVPDAPAPSRAPRGSGPRTERLGAGPLEMRSTTAPTRPGGTVPPRGRLSYVVTAPDGTVLLWGDTDFECDRVGELPSAPDSSPVRTLC